MKVDNDVYEVLIQERSNRQPINVGSVRGPNETLAMHHAREIFARREHCVKIMIVKRSAITTLENTAFLELAHKKTYRQASLEL